MIAMPRHDLRTVIRKLGLSSGLQLCLDAGHETSLPASSTKWVDLSGNGYDFFRGTTAGADSTDPTINGTAGNRSSSEYLSFDGGDLLQYDSTNETWMESLHKDNALFSLMAWFYPATTTANQGIIATCRGNNAEIGWHSQVSTGNVFGTGARAGGSSAINTSAGEAVVDAQWNCLQLTMDEAAGGTASTIGVNGVYTAFDGTYLSPSASSATQTMRIGIRNNDDPIENGGRIASLAMWSGVGLGENQHRALFQATRGKFGV